MIKLSKEAKRLFNEERDLQDVYKNSPICHQMFFKEKGISITFHEIKTKVHNAPVCFTSVILWVARDDEIYSMNFKVTLSIDIDDSVMSQHENCIKDMLRDVRSKVISAQAIGFSDPQEPSFFDELEAVFNTVFDIDAGFWRDVCMHDEIDPLLGDMGHVLV